jgi:AraC-like DNA-binding protein
VLRLVREIALPRLGIVRRFACLRQPGFRAYSMELQGASFDGTASGSVSRAVSHFHNDATFVLEGEWLDRRAPPQWVRPGAARVGPSPGMANDRWQGTRTRLVTVEWDDPPLERVEAVTVSPPTMKAVLEWHAAMFATARAGDEPLLQVLLAHARGLGVPFPTITPREPPAPARRSAEVLNHALTHLSERPMWVDFTSERSERQWRRDLVTSRAWLGLLRGSFRATLNAIRLTYAVTLLAAEEAAVGEVAHALGYASDRALLVALRRAGTSIERIRQAAAAPTELGSSAPGLR